MATLQIFKLLATQCAVARSPTLSPSASPVIHLRRRKTLGMLLGRGGGSGGVRRLPIGDGSSAGQNVENRDSPDEEKEQTASHKHKLKDFLLSSPSPPPLDERLSGNVRVGLSQAGSWSGGQRFGDRSPRPLSATIRQRLLRRAWRPVLVAIPE
ncbi:hypothetical protein DM860_004886 [Cuscuta australis]|uniref:Uncharacterized protein n=1 Tax=Cuscuta australis TaxID=267555 RepID=A0A328DLR3_9ASTE|nr:hypothetical protein DM860_004886 [Cuscuta australis]